MENSKSDKETAEPITIQRGGARVQFPQIWMVGGSIVTQTLHACLPACLPCLIAWHTFALELRGAEQKRTAREVFDVSASVSLMHRVETHQQIWE